MAALLVAIAIMMLFLGVAMPVWNQQARREREEELLFRLKQYAHAIALYQRRVPGGHPPSLDVLVEQRYLRRKYKDPITGEDFAVLRLGQVSAGMTTPLPGMPVPQPGGPGDSRDDEGGIGGPGMPAPGGEGPGRRPGGGLRNSADQPLAGPIRGVVSTSTETSLREWKGRKRYNEWEVTPEDVVPRFGHVIADPAQQGPGATRPLGGPGRPSGSGPGMSSPGGGPRPGGSGPGTLRPDRPGG